LRDSVGGLNRFSLSFVLEPALSTALQAFLYGLEKVAQERMREKENER
jgi:hypothetical protein